MTDIILESIRAFVLLGIVIFLWKAGRAGFELTRKGWNFITVGFALLLMGSLVDITDNFEELNRFVIIGNTPIEAFLEKFVGFLGGFCILAIGLVRWIPNVQHLSDEIAERKRVENALMQSQEHLRNALAKEIELSKLQREFVSMTSHEFRTPLAIIDGTAQRMKSQVDKNRLTPEVAVKRIEKIRAAVKRMTRLMESTLMAAQMEEGKVAVEIEPCNLKTIVAEACARQKEIAPEHIVSCNLTDLPETIQADPGALEQVFANLLSNAVKYAPPATDINVNVFKDQDHVVICVRDHGLGIDENDLPRLFERFFRAKTSIGTAGTGIGLSLVKSLVEMHSGTVKVESQKGEGSTFTIRLPIAGPDQSEHGKAKAA